MKNIQTGDNILKKNKNSYTGNVSCSDCGCKCADVVCRKSTCTDRSAKRKKTGNKEICCNYDVTKNINYKWGTSGLDRITFTRSDISNTKEFYASCLDAYYMNAGKMQQVAPQSYQVITEDLGKI